MELLSSCETFQQGLDTMGERQAGLETRIKVANTNFDKTRAENRDLKEQFNELYDKFNSISLEYQVDKSQTKVQIDNLGYNLAILTAKLPTESFSSTSGVRSGEGDISDNEDGEKDDKEATAKDNTKDEGGAVAGKTSKSSAAASKMKKFVYTSNAVNQPGLSQPGKCENSPDLFSIDVFQWWGPSCGCPLTGR